jgi:hypothetical protein
VKDGAKGEVRGLGFSSALALAVGVAAAPPALAQAPDWASQSFEMAAVPAHVTVGDSVTVRFRIHLHERDLLSDSVPRPTADLPDGVRLLGVTPLRKVGDRALEGYARLAFYRVGRRPLPPFGVPFVRIVSGQRGVLVSDSAFVDIDSVAPPGNPTLKDIKEIERQRGPDPRLVAGAIGATAVAGLWLLRRRRRRAAALSVSEGDAADAGADTVVLGPYEAALARLTQIERERWPPRGQVDRHYEAVADVLRRYLEEAHGIPALERTTSELVWALPPALADQGLRDRCAILLADADLVKFARRRPDEPDAARLAHAARDLLRVWRAAASAAPAAEPDDALR